MPSMFKKFSWGKSSDDLSKDDDPGVNENLVDTDAREKVEELERTNDGLKSQLVVLENQLGTNSKTYSLRVEALEQRLARKERDYGGLLDQFNKLNAFALGQKSQKEDLEKAIQDMKAAGQSNKRVPVKRAGWFIKGMAATVAFGAVVSRGCDANLYDEARIRSVSPISYVFGDSAADISKWIPRAVWYDEYATVSGDTANVHIVETSLSPVREKLKGGSCVMVTGKSDVDPTWVKVEQRVNGKTVYGFMNTKDVNVEQAFIGKPCKALAYGE